LLYRFLIYSIVSTSQKKRLLDIHATSNIQIKYTLHHNSFLNLLYVIALLILNEIQVIFFFQWVYFQLRIFFSNNHSLPMFAFLSTVWTPLP